MATLSGSVKVRLEMDSEENRMKIHSHRCDHCSNLKGESNHWWLRVREQDKFTLQSWDDVKADAPGYEHICSESCATKALSRWMTRPDTQPVVQVQAPSDARVRRANNVAR